MLHIGWAVRDMTPERPAMLQGQMHRRIAHSTMDPLLVTALAMEGGRPREAAILISCDLVGIPEALQAAVQERLAPRLREVPSQNVFLAATHTHTSLVLHRGSYPMPEETVMAPEECLELVASRAAEAAVEAWEQRAPHAVGRAFGHAVVGHNRRVVYTDGTAQMYGRTDREDFAWIEGYEDHSLDLLFTWGADGRLTGVVVDIPCPSQVDEGLEVYSADFWHDIRMELRTRLGEGLFVLPLCGAGGDISPHFLLYGSQEEEMRRRQGVNERQEIARRVADAVERTLACTTPEAGETAFAHRVRRVELTPRQISRKERDFAEAEAVRAAQAFPPDSWWPRQMRRVVERFEGKVVAPPVPVEIHVLRIGEVALATNPFELYTDYGLRMKARSAAPQTMIVQLAAGRGSYLPSARAVEGGGYGAMPAVTEVGPEGGAQLVEETLAMIRELFPS